VAEVPAPSGPPTWGPRAGVGDQGKTERRPGDGSRPLHECFIGGRSDPNASTAPAPGLQRGPLGRQIQYARSMANSQHCRIDAGNVNSTQPKLRVLQLSLLRTEASPSAVEVNHRRNALNHRVQCRSSRC